MVSQISLRVGLALGGGVARGPAHLGVLQAITAAQIPIDMVAGTSAGSIMGVLFAAGLTLDQIRQLVDQMSWGKLARLVWPREGFASMDKLEAWLIKLIGDKNFEDLSKPFCVIATDLETGQPVRFSRGRLAPAVHASCCVPGFIRPVRWDGKILGDGSLVDTVPVDSLRDMGADYVIGVDIFTAAIRPGRGPFGMGFTAIEILVERAGSGTRTADCLIAPELAGMSYLSFKNNQKLIALGRQAAEAKIPEIKAALGC